MDLILSEVVMLNGHRTLIHAQIPTLWFSVLGHRGDRSGFACVSLRARPINKLKLIITLGRHA